MSRNARDVARRAAERVLPESIRPLAFRLARRSWPPAPIARAGTPRRLLPVSRDYGGSRGMPIDRYYIENFLRRNSGASGYTPGAIHGRVMEICDDTYTRMFGRHVAHVDVLDASSENPLSTIVADLADGSNLPSDSYDCVICTQTLLLIYDVRAALGTIHRILKPGGTALITVPGISQMIRPEADAWGDYWRFTSMSARRLLEEVFDPAKVAVCSYGNVLTASAFLYGLATEDLKRRELDLHDPDYEVIIGIKAVK